MYLLIFRMFDYSLQMQGHNQEGALTPHPHPSLPAEIGGKETIHKYLFKRKELVGRQSKLGGPLRKEKKNVCDFGSAM